jgi:alkanesulfonate monooxygenase SsuD/methylene tetrahydromethanopterin reductase-like flavin-dependent oxidoreductase (luciferase family)
MLIGYHTSHEQFPPSELLKYVQMAERAGFTAAMCSDHFHILGASARGIADSHGPGLGQPCKQPASHLASSVHRDSVTILLSSLKPRPPSPPLRLQQLDDFLIQSQGRYAVQRWGA